MIVRVVSLENAASEVSVSAHKHMYSQIHPCELRMFSCTVVFLPHCCALLLKITLLFKSFLLRALLLLPRLLIPMLKKKTKKNLVKAEETKILRMKKCCSYDHLSANLSLQFEGPPSLLLKAEKCQ